VVAQAFILSTQEAEAGDLSAFEASLVYRDSSRTDKATQRNPVWKTNKQTNKQTNCHQKKKQKQKPPKNLEPSIVFFFFFNI
jgi:hypothetical protein